MDDLVEKFGDMSVRAPEAPKGKRSAYSFFMKQLSADLKSRGEGTGGMAQFSKYCSRKWKETSEKEKQKYRRMAAEDTDRCDRDWMKYHKEKEAYDQFIEEYADKGYLNSLEDGKRLRGLITSSVARKKNPKTNTSDRKVDPKRNSLTKKTDQNKNNYSYDSDSDEEDTISELMPKPNKTQKPKPKPKEEEEEEDEEEDDEEDSDEESDEEDSDEEESDSDESVVELSKPSQKEESDSEEDESESDGESTDDDDQYTDDDEEEEEKKTTKDKKKGTNPRSNRMKRRLF